MSAVACYQRNGKTGNLEMLAIDMTAKTDTMQVTDKHRQGTGTGRASCWVMKERNIMSEKNVMHTMQTATLTVFREKQIDIEQILHPDNPSLNISHSVQMMKNVVRLYVSLRLKHFCKTFRQTRLDKNIRRSLAKSILFQNQ